MKVAYRHIIPGLLLSIVLLVCCQQEDSPLPDEERAMSRSLLSLSVSDPNGADIDKRIKTIRVLIFDQAGNIAKHIDPSTAHLPAPEMIASNYRFPESGNYPASRTEITLSLRTAIGTCNIYLIANEESISDLSTSLAAITREEELLNINIPYTAPFEPSEATPFLMVGELRQYEIKAQAINEASITLVRTLSKVAVSLNFTHEIVPTFKDADDFTGVNNGHQFGTAHYHMVTSIRLNTPASYYLITRNNAATHNPISTTLNLTTETKTDWISYKYRYLLNPQQSFTAGSITHHLGASTVIYTPENITGNPSESTGGIKLDFNVSRVNAVGKDISPYYRTSEEIKTFSTFLEFRKAESDPIDYDIPRNTSFNVKATIRDWNPSNIYIKTDIMPWNKENLTEEFAPVEYEWGTWINETTKGDLPAVVSSRQGEVAYFGIRLSHPVGQEWHVSLSNGYDFEFTPESITSGTITDPGASPVFLKFGIRPTRPPSSAANPTTKIYITVNNKKVAGAEINIQQIP